MAFLSESRTTLARTILALYIMVFRCGYGHYSFLVRNCHDNITNFELKSRQENQQVHLSKLCPR